MSEITKRIEKMHEGQILFISDFSDLNGTFLQTQREDSGGVRCEQNRYFIFSKPRESGGETKGFLSENHGFHKIFSIFSGFSSRQVGSKNAQAIAAQRITYFNTLIAQNRHNAAPISKFQNKRCISNYNFNNSDHSRGLYVKVCEFSKLIFPILSR